MKRLAVGMALMLVAVLVLPAMAAGDERHSYITVKDVTVRLEKADAVVTMNYTIDDGIGFLVLLLGKSDLREKALEVLNFDNADVQHLDLERVEVRVKNASNDYGQGSYWFPAHGFGVVVPSLTVISPQDVKHYENVNEFPDGLGYFA
ncbi:hypothetical protein FGW20_06420 [Methanoculleus sp. FWC-SCC3]|uniref:Uncharacterized protein n=1 Tax=Methanoculleus methanifontis TaxID=2584086 RepID=A0ABT8M3R3_9EURY|nr:hypothetical protein [Methanoculleus sp. FWC-SCC3]MDN7012678.1 hypothetical protein [Methanoculleus sp. FWC-SCC3]